MRRAPEDRSGDLFTPNDRTLGDVGAQRGMQTAVGHADAVDPDWSVRAYQLLVEYASSAPAPFIAPQVRAYAEERGLTSPTTNMAWGAVFNRAARAGVIVRDGYEQYGNATMHTQSVSRWRAR